MPFFKPGVWQVSSSGSADVQPFTGRLTVPPAVRISNTADLTSIDHTKDLTVQWNGSDYTDDYVATVQLAASSTVVCRAPASAGQSPSGRSHAGHHARRKWNGSRSAIDAEARSRRDLQCSASQRWDCASDVPVLSVGSAAVQIH